MTLSLVEDPCPAGEGRGHEWGMIEGGRQFCDQVGCSASRPFTDEDAVDFIWGAAVQEPRA